MMMESLFYTKLTVFRKSLSEKFTQTEAYKTINDKLKAKRTFTFPNPKCSFNHRVMNPLPEEPQPPNIQATSTRLIW